MKLKGKVAYITGGSKGIGLGIAEAMAAEGINVAITARNKEELAEAKEMLISKYKVNCIAEVCDVTDLEAQQLIIDKVVNEWGSLDYVIANAGVGHFASIEDMTPKQWKDTIDINLTGVFNTTKASIAALKASKGYLITMASLAGANFFPTASAYNASKFGLVGFTQAVMLDLRKYGIKVTTIMPGSVATYFNNHTPSDADAWKIQPEDLGQMVVDLIKMNPRTLPSKIEVRPSIPA
jgi:NAD(P)-dependent dehydrogenase (short-subunit alcohol dehydrogenase family)